MAPYVGGSRDVCSLLEECIGVMIETTVTKKRQDMNKLHGEESLGLLVGTAVSSCLGMFSRSQACSQIEKLLQVAADVLAVDLDLVRRVGDENIEKDQSKTRDLPSTLHVFLPHRDRGAPGKKRRKSGNSTVPRRQLVNCAAEILIWAASQRLWVKSLMQSPMLPF